MSHQRPPVIQTNMSSQPPKDKDSYYTNGSNKVSEVSGVTLRKLETRRKLTDNNERLVICLVGLPGRGKSFIARKLQTYLTWRGTACKVFNVGRYRRKAQADMLQAIAAESLSDTNTQENEQPQHPQQHDHNDNPKASKRKTVGACDASFFDNNNPLAKELRTRAATMAMADMIDWLKDPNPNQSYSGNNEPTPPPKCNRRASSRMGGMSRCKSGIKASDRKNRLAIFDATNSTAHRRKWVLDELNSPTKDPSMKTGVIFVESVCDDEEMLEENFRFKVQNSPDFEGMTIDEAIADLRERVAKYEEQYETIQDDTQSYIKIFNLSSKLLVNHVYGTMAKVVVPSLMSWNIGSRPIYLCRAGETGSESVNEDSVSKPSGSGSPRRGGMLGESGRCFRDALAQFIEQEGFDFAAKRESALKEAFTPSKVNIGTSVSGLAPSSHSSSVGKKLPFTCHVMASTMPRAVETATWESLPCEIHELPNLNPLDKGDFSGMELEDIKAKNPHWYELLEDDPFTTRFPGGECYKDLINRLETCIIDMEQQMNMVCVVSHISVLQVLMAYFSRTPIEKCSSIRVPMHTVIKYTPVTGGSWSESHHALGPEIKTADSLMYDSDTEENGPIWGDHRIRKSSTTAEQVDYCCFER